MHAQHRRGPPSTACERQRLTAAPRTSRALTAQRHSRRDARRDSRNSRDYGTRGRRRNARDWRRPEGAGEARGTRDGTAAAADPAAALAARRRRAPRRSMPPSERRGETSWVFARQTLESVFQIHVQCDSRHIPTCADLTGALPNYRYRPKFSC